MTLSPNTLTSIEPLALSTNLVRISRMAFDLALTSIAHTPSTTGSFVLSSVAVTSEYELVEEGDDERVTIALERGEPFSGELKREDIDIRECLSQYMITI